MASVFKSKYALSSILVFSFLTFKMVLHSQVRILSNNDLQLQTTGSALRFSNSGFILPSGNDLHFNTGSSFGSSRFFSGDSLRLFLTGNNVGYDPDLHGQIVGMGNIIDFGWTAISGIGGRLTASDSIQSWGMGLSSGRFFRLGVGNGSSNSIQDAMHIYKTRNMSLLPTNGNLIVGASGDANARLSVNGDIAVDRNGLNNGTIQNSLRFGNDNSGTAIGSNRTSGAGGALNFFVDSDSVRFRMTNTGKFLLRHPGGASIQFPNDALARKIVLYESPINASKFDGIGVSPQQFRFNTYDQESQYAFYTDNLRKFTIVGDSTYYDPDIVNDNSIGIGKIADGGGWYTNVGISGKGDQTTFAIGAGGNNLYIGAGIKNVANSLQTAIQVNGNRNIFLAPFNNAKVGIGTTNPKGHLSFGNSLTNRKVVLYQEETLNDDHQFLGLGINGYTMRFQVSTSADTFKFYNGTSSTSSNLLFYIAGSGNVRYAGSIGLISDARLKKDFKLLTTTLDQLLAIRGYQYKWIDPNKDQTLQTGLKAQEVQKVFPDLVNEGNDGILSVNYIGLLPHIIESLRDLKAQNDKLKEENSSLRKEFEAFKSEIMKVVAAKE
jgi:hypothetical protein